MTQITMTNCPICGQPVDTAFDIETDEPFTAYDPREGLYTWGPYDAPKTTICFAHPWVHFQIGQKTRLVKMVKTTD